MNLQNANTVITAGCWLVLPKKLVFASEVWCLWCKDWCSWWRNFWWWTCAFQRHFKGWHSTRVHLRDAQDLFMRKAVRLSRADLCIQITGRFIFCHLLSVYHYSEHAVDLIKLLISNINKHIRGIKTLHKPTIHRTLTKWFGLINKYASQSVKVPEILGDISVCCSFSNKGCV